LQVDQGEETGPSQKARASPAKDKKKNEKGAPAAPRGADAKPFQSARGECDADCRKKKTKIRAR